MTGARLLSLSVFGFGLLLISNNECTVKAEDEDMLEEASKYLLFGANLKANPCENFFNYTCGSWRDNVKKIYNSTREDEEYQLWAGHHDRLLSQAIDAHRKTASAVKPQDVPNYVKWTLTFYDQCLEKAKKDPLTKSEKLNHAFRYVGEKLGGYPENILKSKGAPPTSKSNANQSVWRIQAVLQKYFGTGLFFVTDFTQIVNPCGEEKFALKFVPPKPFTDSEQDTIRQQMQNLTRDLKIEMSQENLSKMVKNIASLSSDLNLLIKNNTADEKTSAEGGEIDESSKVYDLEGLMNVSKRIEWENFLKFLFTENQLSKYDYKEEAFSLANDDYFSELNKILSKYDYDTVLSVAFWRVMKDAQAELEKEDEEEQSDCLTSLKKYFASAATRMIFDSKGWKPVDWRTDLEMLFENLRAAFKFFISSSDWIDDEDKMNVIKKANHIAFYSGIPNWLENDTEVNRRTFQFDPAKSMLENELNAHQQLFNLKLDQVVSGAVDEDEEPDFTINAYYGNMRISLLVGHMLPPTYHPDYPLPLKYALLGWTLGHEFFHAFDENHVTETPPKVQQLLKEGSIRAYEMKKPCLKKQISSYCFTRKGKCVSGKQTLAETMADVDGLKIAFMAYKFASLTQSMDPPIPGLIDMSPDKIFFMMVGRSYCASNQNLALYLDRVEEHAPSQSRMQISIRNFRAFAKAFNCPLGSVEAPVKTCKVWGDYYGEITPWRPYRF